MALYQLINYIFQALYFLLLARVIISWIPHNRFHPVIQLLYSITEPILEPFRRIMPPTAIGIDFSPILAFIVLGILRSIIFSILVG